MLTPQEVSERVFPKASFGGYNMAQVDEFLDILTSDYTALYNENTVLKGKMKVLVEKVEEYRSTEEAMRKALMTAQRMADDLVADAQKQKEQILRDAQAQAQERIQEISREVENEQYRLESAKKETAAYVEKVRALHGQAQEYLDKLQELAPPQPEPEKPDPVEEAVSEIDDNVQRLLAQAMAEATAENRRSKLHASQQKEELSDTAEFTLEDDADREEEEEEPEEQESTRRIDFGKLQFGRDYEIK